MSYKYVFNPLQGRAGGIDLVEDDVIDVVTPDATAVTELEVDQTGVVWFWSNGHRYKLTGTLADPAAGSTSGTPMGLLLALTYP